MGKNKQCRNAYYYFVMDFKSKTPRKFETAAAAFEAAAPHWELLSPSERKKYEDRAKVTKANQPVVKYTNTGVQIDVMQRRLNEENAREERMREDIDETIQSALESNQIAEHYFYLIHINYFCYCNSSGQYVPAEIAVARFNLKEGVMQDDVFHFIIKPGAIPLGYSFNAKKTSDETHKIQPPLGDEGEDNQLDVLNGFLQFLRKHNEYSNLPPLYAERTNIEVVKNVLKIFCLKFGYREDFFKVYLMDYMFYSLRNNVSSSGTSFPTISMSTLALEKDCYDFTRDIPCPEHILSDVPNHCSRSHVIRLAYIICDNCCSDLGIELIPGQHVPCDANITNIRPPSHVEVEYEDDNDCASSVYSTASAKSTSKASVPFHDTKEDYNNYYLSQRTESSFSCMSDTNSLYEDVKSKTEYESEASQSCAEDAPWIECKQKRGKFPSQSSDGLRQQSSFNSSGGNEMASGSSVSTVRRPYMPSAFSTAGSSSSVGSSMKPVGRGRGRGIGNPALLTQFNERN